MTTIPNFNFAPKPNQVNFFPKMENPQKINKDTYIYDLPIDKDIQLQYLENMKSFYHNQMSQMDEILMKLLSKLDESEDKKRITEQLNHASVIWKNLNQKYVSYMEQIQSYYSTKHSANSVEKV
jgi:hypothetical protein